VADKRAFWSSIKVLASAFREEDPQLTGTMRQMVEHFNALPEAEKLQLRHDIQLLSVQFSKLAMVMTEKLDDQHRPA
jgi:hypothetical protein